MSKCQVFRFVFGRMTIVNSINFPAGLHSLKFVPPESVFADVSVNPDNGCWCVPDLDHCLGAGVLNISSCQFGAPVVSSSPHLFQVAYEKWDDWLTNWFVRGLPNWFMNNYCLTESSAYGLVHQYNRNSGYPPGPYSYFGLPSFNCIAVPVNRNCGYPQTL